jgi:SAM-dependent methyltransferase
MALLQDAKERFSTRVGNYAKHRPGYPRELLNLLERECGLAKDSVVADIGSGTGIFSELFLKHGNDVYAVEPNAAMRASAEQALAGHAKFHSVAGSAEATGLSDGSVDLIAAAQAFHWFQPAGARREFRRVLRPAGLAVILWNNRKSSGTAFLEAYEALLQRFGTDYADVSHRWHNEHDLSEFFGTRAIKTAKFPNHQLHDWEGLKGRLLSSSYVPDAGQPGYELMLAELERIFSKHERDGRVMMEYEVEVLHGRLEGA